MLFKLPVVFFSILVYFVEGHNRPCNGTVVGRVKNNELNELSGLVESHRFPDVFYSIEDSGNEPVVYVINKNGTLRGEIILDRVKNNDFEDIAISSGRDGDDNYIYVGDIGNDWPGHCQGVNQTHRMVHMFREPYINQYQHDGKLTMPRNRITTFILEDQERVCNEEFKEDTEAMFIDPISSSGYIIQKVRPRNTRKDPLIFRFNIPSPESLKPQWIQNGVFSSFGVKLALERVGNIPLVDKNSKIGNYTWPAFITGGDISKDGKQIFLRGYDGVRIFNRDTSIGESVETALIHNVGRDIPLCNEAGQGESIAIKQDGTGFYTVTEAKGEDDSNKVDVPISFYSLEEEGPVYKKSDTTDRCCTTNGLPHRRCHYYQPGSFCKDLCSKDENCKGYSEGKFHSCQLATTSVCSQEKFIDAYDGDNSKLDPTATCGESGSWNGCFIKEVEDDMCEHVFDENPSARCIFYDGERCKHQKGSKVLQNSNLIKNLEETANFEVESISVRSGCRLTVYTGQHFNGKYHKYAAAEEHLHITFNQEEHPALQNFNKNVNSAVCTCITLPVYLPFSPTYYPFPYYPFAKTILYPFLPYANFLHSRNWFHPVPFYYM